MHKKILGFTLVELLVTISVGAIVLAIGVPSFQSLIQTNQLATQTNKFIGSLNYARSEAVKRKQNITICPSTSPGICSAGNRFENGWLVFVDFNRDGNFNSDANGTDASLWFNDALSDRLTLNSTNTRFSFNANGRVSGGPGNLVVCVDNDTNLARRIVVPTSGNVRIADNNITPINSCP